MRSPLQSGLFVLLLLLTYDPAYAQRELVRKDADSSHFFIGATVSVGIGSVAEGEGDVGLAMLGDVFVRYDAHIVALRAAAAIDLFTLDLYDYSLLYGRALPLSSSVELNLMAGLGLMGGTRSYGILSGREPTPLPKHLSLPLQTELVWTPLPWLGLGLCGFANINTEQSFGGFTAAVQVGKLR